MKTAKHPGGRPRLPENLTEIGKPPEEVRDPRFAVLDAQIAAEAEQEARAKVKRPAKKPRRK
ncbi:MAG: hypothetical protein NT090_04805, partial [Acidobacteria bacterium]|nr:hypothetical protein [Acidobacteriota bacterium]